MNSPVNLYMDTTRNGPQYFQVRSSQVLQHIRNTVTQIGVDTLRFKPTEVGTHSIRSSFYFFPRPGKNARRRKY